MSQIHVLLPPEETSVLPTGDTSFLHVLVSDKPPQNTSTSRSPNQSKQDLGFGIALKQLSILLGRKQPPLLLVESGLMTPRLCIQRAPLWWPLGEGRVPLLSSGDPWTFSSYSSNATSVHRKRK